MYTRLATHDISLGLPGNRALPTNVTQDQKKRGVQYRSRFHTDSDISRQVGSPIKIPVNNDPTKSSFNT